MRNTAKTTSRRDFLRQLSIGTAAVTAGVSFTGLPQAPAPKKMSVALLGLGRYATGQLAPALQSTQSCYLAGVVTGHPEKAAQWQKQYSLKDANIYNYDNFDKIVDNPDIDIVYVVTPPALHPEYVIRAAKAGKHVISEKPMATSVADCHAMIDV